MSYSIHTIESAPAASKPVLTDIEKAFGFIPNLSGVLAHSPLALTAYQAISGLIQEKAALTTVEQQLVMLAVSYENECTYCMAAHSLLAGMAKVPDAAIEALRKGALPEEPKWAALVRFARTMTAKRGWISEEEQQAFAAAGYNPTHTLDVVAIIALKTISNYVNHLAHTPLDPAFARQAWTKSA
ncbi:MAG TPA: carboxymuconolactone decarboxylase family protein [Kiritimatiellia bacterium]|nr:carboxymuconolactone decarboxylase family protein [Kiritimatiellia bacterium]